MQTPSKLFSTLVLTAALTMPAAVLAQRVDSRVELLPPAAGDLVATRLATGPFPEAAPAIERAEVSFSWPLATDSQPTEVAESFQAASREYWFQVEGRDLVEGVVFSTTAPGALVRINPLPGAEHPGAAIDPSELRLIDPRDNAYADGSGMEQLASADQLRQAGVAFAEGTTAFRLGQKLGAGRFTLQADRLATPQARYVVHLFDRGSDAVLHLSSDRGSYLHGDRIRIEASLTTRHGALELDEITAFVTSPAGRGWPVLLRPVGHGLYAGSLRLDGTSEVDAQRGGGLWQVLVSAHGVDHGRTVMRSARTAFSAAAATARLVKASAFGRGERALTVRFEVEAAVAGRYEVRGVLYGTGRDGALHPAIVAHSAAWIEAGSGGLRLAFDPEAVRAAGLRAPYEIRDLRLMDQGRMGLLHRQARGVVIRN